MFYYKTPEDLKVLRERIPNAIYVFGSSTNGEHDRGDALLAYNEYGAIKGRERGAQGRSYAIPVMDEYGNPLSYDEVVNDINEFVKYNRRSRQYMYIVTKVGCTEQENFFTAELFRGIVNAIYHSDWREDVSIVIPTR